MMLSKQTNLWGITPLYFALSDNLIKTYLFESMMHEDIIIVSAYIDSFMEVRNLLEGFFIDKSVIISDPVKERYIKDRQISKFLLAIGKVPADFKSEIGSIYSTSENYKFQYMNNFTLDGRITLNDYLKLTGSGRVDYIRNLIYSFRTLTDNEKYLKSRNLYDSIIMAHEIVLKRIELYQTQASSKSESKRHQGRISSIRQTIAMLDNYMLSPTMQNIKKALIELGVDTSMCLRTFDKSYSTFVSRIGTERFSQAKVRTLKEQSDDLFKVRTFLEGQLRAQREGLGLQRIYF